MCVCWAESVPIPFGLRRTNRPAIEAGYDWKQFAVWLVWITVYCRSSVIGANYLRKVLVRSRFGEKCSELRSLFGWSCKSATFQNQPTLSGRLVGRALMRCDDPTHSVLTWLCERRSALDSVAILKWSGKMGKIVISISIIMFLFYSLTSKLIW